MARAAFASIALTGVSATSALTGCSNKFSAAPSTAAKNVNDSLGCSNFEDALWTGLTKAIEDTGHPPLAKDIEDDLKAKMTKGRLNKMSIQAKTEVSALAGEIAGLISQNSDGEISVKSGEAVDEDARRGLWLERIAQLEIGDRTTESKSNDVDLIQEKIARLKAIAENEGLVGVACAVAAPPSGTAGNVTIAGTMFDRWKTTQAAPVYGALKTVATMYQSCDAATHRPLGSETLNVDGISVTGRHPSGGGNIRQITDKKAYLSSHPYIGSGVYKRPLPTCFDVQATPSIYDYGGKPYTSTTNEKVLDLFKNGGTGSRELGIDCSAMVYSAYATVGLKFKKTTPLKATLINGVSSTMLTQPQKNGLTCLNHASFSAAKSLQPGDIIAIAGHVVMVASVGSDPFGIASVNSVLQCRASALSIGNFNFNIFQSDPSKGGIGANQMQARYYLSSFSTMGRGMLDHAVNACKAKFQTAPIVTTSSSASVVRHLGTADCIDAQPVKLNQEECLSSCSARPVDSI